MVHMLEKCMELLVAKHGVRRLWDTAGMLIDNHSKTHMIFIWSVLYSRVSFVVICSGNFAWSRCWSA